MKLPTLTIAMFIISFMLNAQPDLEVLGGSVGPTTVTPGGSFNVGRTILNSGTSGATSSKTGFYLSTNQIWSTADIFLAHDNITYLGSGSTDYSYGSIPIPASVAPGQYYLFIVADYLNNVSESNESNNTYNFSGQITVNALNPCNSIISINACGLLNAQTFSTSGTGNWYTSATNPCGFFSSPGKEQIYSFTAPVTGTYSLSVNVPSGNTWVDYFWKSGSCSSSGWNCIVPAGINSGGTYGQMSWTAGTTYYIMLDNSTTSTTNTHTFWINCPQLGPDLDIPACSVSSTSVQAGGTITGTAVVRNNGNSTSGQSSTLAYYLSTNCVLDASDIRLNTDNTSILSPGNTDTDSDPLTIPGITPAGTYYILFKADDSNVISETDENNNTCCKQITVTPCSAPSQPGAISGASTSCSGTNQSYSISGVSGATSYTWKFKGLTLTGSGTSISFSPISSGTLSVEAVNSCGTSTARTKYISVSSAPAQPGPITGSTTVCTGTNQSYSISSVSGATSYTWKFKGLTLTGSGTSISFSPISSGTLTVEAVNSCGTSTARTKYISVSSAPAQPGPIAGSTTVCAGTNQSYSIPSVSGATSYSWSFSGGGSPSGSGTSVSFSPTSSGTLTVYAINSCGQSVAATIAINVITVPAQPGPITGSTTVCSGTNQTYSIPSVSGATSYSWSFSGGGSPTGSGTSVSFSPTSSGTLTVYAINSCGQSVAATIAINVITVPAQPGPITGSTTVCSGTNQTYSIPSVSGATSYSWSFSGGGSPTGSGTSVSFSPTSSGTLTVYAINSCGQSVAATIAINVITVPAQPGPITGSTTVCSGTNQTYSIPSVSGATSYSWSFSGGGSPTGSGTSVSFSPTSSGTLTVYAINSCGQSVAATIAINVITVPAQPGPITGSTTVCDGVNQVYSIPSVSGVTSYSWSFSGGGSPTGSGTSVSFSPTSSGTLTVYAINSCGQSVAATLAITVMPLPNKPSTISGKNNVMANATENYSVNNDPNATSYTWQIPSDWNLMSGSNTNAIVVQVGSLSGFISAKALNSCGESDTTILVVSVDNGSIKLNESGDFQNGISLFPNPTKGIINIDSSVKIEKVEILTLGGKTLVLINDIKESIQLNNYGIVKGVYICRITDEKNQTKTIKVVVN